MIIVCCVLCVVCCVLCAVKINKDIAKRRDCNHVFSLKLNVQAQTHLFSYSTGYEEHPQLRGGAKN